MKKQITIYILLFCMALFQSHTESSERYRIKGIIDSSLNGCSVVLRAYDPYDNLTQFSDTAVIKDGTFYFEGKACPTLAGQLLINSGPYYNTNNTIVFLDGGDITVEMSATNTPSLIHGSKINDDYQLYKDSVQYYIDEIERNLTDENRTPNSITIKVGSKLADIYLNWANMARNFKRENISNAAGKIALFNDFQKTPESFYIDVKNLTVYEMYDYLDSTMLKHPTVDAFVKYTEKRHARASKYKNFMNHPFTDFECITTDKKPKMLSEYIGNSEYVLLNFWASWCAPCLREMPELKAIYDQFHDKGFDIIGISVDEDHEKWIDQLNKTDTPWTNLRNKPENLKDMKDAYLFDSIPHGILIDKQGNVVGIMEIETLRNRLERDLK